MAAGSTEESEESRLLSKKKEERESWLIEMVREEDDPRPQSRLEYPPIQMVPDALGYHSHAHFRRHVVSLGLYPSRSCEYRLKGSWPMDRHKEDAVRWFVSLLSGPANANSEYKVMKIYEDFVIKASRDSYHRDWYPADYEPLKDEEIAYVMFLDGCFILHFVYLSVKKPEIRNPYLDQVPLIVRDMFVLENQIPYSVLKSLMDLMPDTKPLTKQDLEKFIEIWFLPAEYGSINTWSSICGSGTFDKRDPNIDNPSTSNSADKDPLHLLDFLRTKLIGGPVDTSEEYHAYFSPSIMELKAAGIKLRRSHSSNLNKIEFNHDLIGRGALSLPRIIINDKTKTRLLNLVAYEMCPGCPHDPARVITSYICFLGSLIHHADDVKELRLRGILLRTLGNDEEVVKLFKEVTINLVPDPRIYAEALTKIQLHCMSRVRVRWGEMLNTYFGSPWTAISLVAAILLLFLTAMQTIFTVW